MKKVLVSAYACIPGRGSEEGNGWHYASVISQHDCEVWCLTRRLGEQKIMQKLEENPHPHLKFVFVDVPEWVDKAYHKGLLGMYFHYLYWQWAAWRVAKPLNEKYNFDVVHHVSYGSLQLGSFLYKLQRPFVFGPVGGGQEAPEFMRHYFKQHWRKEQLRSLISRLLVRFNPGCFQSVRQAQHVLVWNEDTRRMVQEIGRTAAVSKEFSGVSQSFIPAEPLVRDPQPVLRLVWVGRLLPRKALELTLQGLGKVSREIPVHLTIVGDGPMGEYMPQYLTDNNVQDRVSWVGRVDYDQVRGYYQQADVFYFTSLRDTGPAQLLEAMAYSLPVVTLNIHGQAELVNDSTGIRVPVVAGQDVAADLATAIEWMYHNREARLQMGISAYHFASQQTWELKIGRLIDTYYGPRPHVGAVEAVCT